MVGLNYTLSANPGEPIGINAKVDARRSILTEKTPSSINDGVYLCTMKEVILNSNKARHSYESQIDPKNRYKLTDRTRLHDFVLE